MPWSWTVLNDVLWRDWPRILSEDLVAPAEPLRLLLRPRCACDSVAVARAAARELLGVRDSALPLPDWLAPHQIPAALRLHEIVQQYGGALLADAVGLGKSYAALGLALARRESVALVVPAVLVAQWRALLVEKQLRAPIVTHESLSVSRDIDRRSEEADLVVVDEAHRFRNARTRRYRALSRMVIGARVLLITATPVHNRLADVIHLFRLFLRDDALASLGIASLNCAARDAKAAEPLLAALARLAVARSRRRVRGAYPKSRSIEFATRHAGTVIRAGPLPPTELAGAVRAILEFEASACGPLIRLIWLTRLASSVAALRDSLKRHEAFVEFALRASSEGRALTTRDFNSLWPSREADALQLALFPMLLTEGG